MVTSVKNIILITLLLFSNLLFAETLFHDIERGRLHKGGEIKIEVLEMNDKKFTTRLSYKIKKKVYVPIGDSKLRGDVVQSLPAMFSSLEGYLDLEKMGSLKVEKATVKFIQRESIGEYYDSIKIQITPDNKKWSGYLWYHPSVPGSGWFKCELTLLGIPVLGDYSLKSFIR